MQKKRIFFYSNVRSKSLFGTQRFYKIDIDLLKKLGYTITTTNQISSYFLFWKYDIAFIYFYKYGFFVSFIARFFGKQVYFTGGIDDLDEEYASLRKYILQKFFFKLCYIFSTKCILVSKADQQNVEKIFDGKLLQKISFSSHTIEVANFIDTDLSRKENIFTTIAWMGNIVNVHRKGIDRTLYVFKRLLAESKYHDAKLYIIGEEGAGSEYLKKIGRELDIMRNVVFTGSIIEEYKINILKRSKFYFQFSSYEGFGIAALEALACMNIVIHSGKGGLRDTVKDYGIIIDIYNDLNDQVLDICKKINNFDLHKLLEAQEYIKNRYSNEQRFEDFKKILK